MVRAVASVDGREHQLAGELGRDGAVAVDVRGVLVVPNSTASGTISTTWTPTGSALRPGR